MKGRRGTGAGTSAKRDRMESHRGGAGAPAEGDRMESRRGGAEESAERNRARSRRGGAGASAENRPKKARANHVDEHVKEHVNEQHGGEWHEPPSRWSIIMGVFLFMAVFLLLMAAAYGLTALLYRKTGAPPEIWRNLITGMGGVILLSIAVNVFRFFGQKRVFENRTVHNALTDALAQIAQGNFNITLDTFHGQHQYLAKEITDMAQKLGTLETMRQDFISNVSHEIRSPLTSIGGFAALLQKQDLPPEERRRYAEIIEAESKRLSSLSDNLLKLTALEEGQKPLEKQAYRLDRQLEQIALTLEPQWSAKDITLEADLQKQTIFADEDLLSQVWINLLHNAIKFTPPEGRVSIGLETNDNTAVINISDTGAGIGPDDLPHIFERFYKADKSRDRALGGNGLGLSLVKKIVELHGGAIAVESEVGRGTRFQVLLPLAWKEENP